MPVARTALGHSDADFEMLASREPGWTGTFHLLTVYIISRQTLTTTKVPVHPPIPPSRIHTYRNRPSVTTGATLHFYVISASTSAAEYPLSALLSVILSFIDPAHVAFVSVANLILFLPITFSTRAYHRITN